MKSEDLKLAFNRIAAEAGNDENLTRQIIGKARGQAGQIPVAEIKALFKYFLMIFLPVLIIYALLSTVGLQPSATPDYEAMIEKDSYVAWQVTDFSFNCFNFSLTFVEGVVRAFLILLVLTFILTAAAMPVRRSENLKGDLHHA